MVLAKKNVRTIWKSLEKLDSGEPVVAPKYPSSARKPLDMEKLDEELKEESAGKEPQMDEFFKALYKDADEDTRKAMMKSFVPLALRILFNQCSPSLVEPCLALTGRMSRRPMWSHRHLKAWKLSDLINKTRL